MTSHNQKRPILLLLLLNANILCLLASIAIALTSYVKPVRWSWRLGTDEWHAVQCDMGRVTFFFTTISNHFRDVPQEIDRFAFAYLDTIPRSGNFGFGSKQGHSGSPITELSPLESQLRTDITTLIESTPQTDHFRAQLGQLLLIRGWTWMMFPIWLIILPLLLFPLLALRSGPILRWKRRRNNRCVHCGYSLNALESNRCPECGQIVSAPPQKIAPSEPRT